MIDAKEFDYKCCGEIMCSCHDNSFYMKCHQCGKELFSSHLKCEWLTKEEHEKELFELNKKEPGKYLLPGPDWKGNKVEKVEKSEAEEGPSYCIGYEIFKKRNKLEKDD